MLLFKFLILFPLLVILRYWKFNQFFTRILESLNPRILISIAIAMLILFCNTLYAQDTNAVIIPDDPDIIFNNGLKELQKGNIPNAISLLEKLLSYNTENPDYYIYLGYLYYVQGNYDKAVEVIKRSLKIDDDLVIGHILLGEIYYEKNNILEARNEFEEVIQIDPKVKLAHIRLYELFKNNNPSKANKHYLEIFPLPQTKLENFLPGIEKIGDINLPFNKNILVLKDTLLNNKKNIKEKKILDEIFKDLTEKSNKQKIIISIKDKKFNFNFKFLLNPLKNFSKEKFYSKIIELVFISIFLLIYSFFQRKKEKKLERIVLNQYRVSNIQKE